MQNRNYNYDYSEANISASQETANNSFGDKETKEVLYSLNNALCIFLFMQGM